MPWAITSPAGGQAPKAAPLPVENVSAAIRFAQLGRWAPLLAQPTARPTPGFVGPTASPALNLAVGGAVATAAQVGQLARALYSGYGLGKQVLGLISGARASQKARSAQRKAGGALHRAAVLGHSPVIAARLAAARVGIHPDFVAPLGSASPLFNPRTRAVDTEQGLILDYGEGQAAEDARREFVLAQERELSRRPFPGLGLLPGPFVRQRRVV